MGKRPIKTAPVESDDETDSGLALDEVEDRIAVLGRGRPPLPYTLEDFRDKFGLSASGINPHRARDCKGITQTDLVEVFGPQRGKSGFFFGDCKDSELRSAIQKNLLHCIPTSLCSQKQTHWERVCHRDSG